MGPSEGIRPWQSPRIPAASQSPANDFEEPRQFVGPASRRKESGGWKPPPWGAEYFRRMVSSPTHLGTAPGLGRCGNPVSPLGRRFHHIQTPVMTMPISARQVKKARILDVIPNVKP